MVDLNKEILKKGEPHKIQMRRAGPCNTLAKYGKNAYKAHLPKYLGLPPTFNIVDLVQYHGPILANAKEYCNLTKIIEKFPKSDISSLVEDKILCSRVGKKTRSKTYIYYLVKWKGKVESEATWVPKIQSTKIGIFL